MPTKKRSSPTGNLPVPVTLIERRIYLIRGKKVMIDSDLAELYAVKTKALNRTVKRNLDRFPEDFMFQLIQEEADVEVPDWYIKHRTRRTPLSSICFY